jgi:Fe-S cluster biosynthesis and repair protein YggX
MDAFALHLPKHLYTETRDEGGVVTCITYAADKLAAWSGNGCGDAAGKLCQQIYDSEIEQITAWEDQQLMLLEEQWLMLENGEDDEAEEAQYDLACDAVCSEAQEQRLVARQRMEQRRAAIDRLVHESMEHLANTAPEQEESHFGGYLIALLMLAAIVYVLLT